MTVIVGPFANVLAPVGLLPSDLLLLEEDVRVTTLPLGNVVLLVIRSECGAEVIMATLPLGRVVVLAGLLLPEGLPGRDSVYTLTVAVDIVIEITDPLGLPLELATVVALSWPVTITSVLDVGSVLSDLENLTLVPFGGIWLWIEAGITMIEILEEVIMEPAGLVVV